jgi:flagellar biosynthesis protein FliP
MGALRIVLTLALMLAAPLAFAADPLSIPAITLGTNAQGAQEYSVSLQILLIMTALSFIPAFVMLMTSFTRIIIVFSILRQALGLQQTPSNQILTGMALFLTLFIMAPVFDRVNQDACSRTWQRNSPPRMPWPRPRCRSRTSCSRRPVPAIWSCSCACPSAPTLPRLIRRH